MNGQVSLAPITPETEPWGESRRRTRLTVRQGLEARALERGGRGGFEAEELPGTVHGKRQPCPGGWSVSAWATAKVLRTEVRSVCAGVGPGSRDAGWGVCVQVAERLEVLA